jgi:hypothetical protein
MRKATALVLAFVLLVSAATSFAYISTSAQSGSTVIVLQIGSKTMMVDGRAMLLDSPPVILEGRTLLPVRAIIEGLGGTAMWDAINQQVTVTLQSTTVVLWIGQQTARVNGELRPIDPDNSLVVPRIVSSRTMLPIRFVAESLGCTVEWNATLRSVTVTLTVTPDTTATKVMQPSVGGRVQLDDGAEVTIPKGVLSASTEVTITRKTVSEAGVALPTALLTGGVYDISAGTASVSGGTATISLPLVPGAQNPALYYLDGDVWVFWGGEVVGTRIVAETDHFSLWTVLEGLPTRIVPDYKPEKYGFAFCNCTDDYLRVKVAQECKKCKNGICAGMAAASYVLYMHGRVAPACAKFVGLSEEWQRYLIAMHVANNHEWLVEAVTRTIAAAIEGGQVLQVSTLWARLAVGMITPIALYWTTGITTAGITTAAHEILVYGMRRRSSAAWDLLAYDPNYPGVETTVSVTLSPPGGQVRFSINYEGNPCVLDVDWLIVDTSLLPATNDCPLPDLQAYSVVWDPVPGQEGSDTEFYAAVKNAGRGCSEAFSVVLKLDGQQVATGTVSELDPGEERTIWLTPSWTATTGCKTVQVVVDPDNKVSEENENNNTLVVTRQLCPMSKTPDVGIRVDRGCGSTYKLGETIRIYGTSSIATQATYVVQRPDTTSTLIRTLEADKETLLAEGTLDGPTGQRTYLLRVTANGQTVEKSCSIGVSSGTALAVDISVDKGCGASYCVGDGITMRMTANADGTGTILDRTPDGLTSTFRTIQMTAGSTYTITTTITPPTGIETVILQFSASDSRTAQDSCSFTVADCSGTQTCGTDEVRLRGVVSEITGCGTGWTGPSNVIEVSEVVCVGSLPGIHPTVGSAWNVPWTCDVTSIKGTVEPVALGDYVEVYGRFWTILWDGMDPDGKATGGMYCYVDVTSKASYYLRKVAGSSLHVSIIVDKGCGSLYNRGDGITYTYSVSSPAYLTLTSAKCDGSVQTFFTDNLVDAGTYQTSTSIASDAADGARTLTLTARDTSTGATRTSTCVFYVGRLNYLAPNIYLYPEGPTDVQVQLLPENRITVSQPTYIPGGWKVSVNPDGSIAGTPGYLFYEADGPSLWTVDSGWVMARDEFATAMPTLLGQIGLNDSETADFMDYWSVHLPSSLYYAFGLLDEDLIDEAVALKVTPTPTTLRRIWFGVVLLDTPMELKHPMILPIVREGFTVVEWGVTFMGKELLQPAVKPAAP